MIRSPAGYGGENRIKRYLDYYQPSYGAMMLAEGLFGFSTPAGVLLGAETSGMAIDFTSTPTSTLVRTANSLSTNYYSGLPFQNEGNGPVTFSRASNATVTDSDGKIKWAGHNLLTNSESFDASAWIKGTGGSISANSVVAPDGSTTADAYTWATTTASFAYLSQALSSGQTPTAPHTFSIWLKRPSGSGNKTLVLNISDNTVSTGSSPLFTITENWQLFSYTRASSTNTGQIGVGLGSGNGSIVAGDVLHVWGAHLYRSDLGGMVLNPARGDAYYPTTPRNLLGFTEDFSNAYWDKNSAAITANIATAPNGLQTADLLLASAGTAVRPYAAPFNAITGVLSTPLVASIYAKQGTARYLQIWNAAGPTSWHVNFDLQTGTKGSENNCTGAIQSVGDGWYRCSVAYSPSLASNINMLFQIVTSSTSARAEQWNPVGTESIYLWGAQLSDSASLDAYSPVYGAAVTSAAYYAPRLDFDGATLAANGLLVEEQRTNVTLFSACRAADWTAVGGSLANADKLSPDNSAFMCRYTEDTATSPHQAYVSTPPAVMTLSTLYTGSVYLAAGTRRYVVVQCGPNPNCWGVTVDTTNWTISGTFTFGGGVYSSSTITHVGNNIYRVTVTGQQTSGGGAQAYISVSGSLVSNATIGAQASYTATGGTFYFWGAQFETTSGFGAAPFATSYIPNGSAVAGATRTADVASVSTQAFPYSSTAGSYVANFQTLFSGANSLTTTILTVDGSGSKLIAYIAGGAQNPGTFDGSTIISVANDVTGSVAKIGSSFDASGRSFCANGSTVATGTVAAGYGSGSAVNIGGTLGTGYINGWFRQLTYIPRRLSSSELQARTL